MPVVNLGLVPPILSPAVLQPEDRRGGVGRDMLFRGGPDDGALELKDLLGIEGVANRPMVQAALNSLVCSLLAGL